MATFTRRLSAVLLLMAAVMVGLWGYLQLVRADRQPPQGATFVWASPGRSDAYLYASDTD